jgi:hypothetical protein
MVMRKITFSADKADIQLARESARIQNTTLEDVFHVWLREVAAGGARAREYRALMQRLRYVNAGRKSTRDEMNERRSPFQT